MQELDDFNAKFICTCLLTTTINKCSLVITLQDVCWPTCLQNYFKVQQSFGNAHIWIYVSNYTAQHTHCQPDNIHSIQMLFIFVTSTAVQSFLRVKFSDGFSIPSIKIHPLKLGFKFAKFSHIIRVSVPIHGA